ncbi:MAG: hypothetical protein A2Y96_02845 [Firmicutes bacterium RBG_13_65_8]|nr:MAG: hypothetical protein A2Y96_02845 [Firmicutes bacterium RBG_13_65_8]
MVIDVHNHYYPLSYLRELRRRPGEAVLEGDPDGQGDVVLRYSGDYNVIVHGHRRLDHRLRDMDAAGVDTHVLSLTTPGVHVEPCERGVRLAALVNDEFAAAVRSYPGRFQAFAALPLQDPPAAARELERACGKLGLVGGLLFSNINGVFPDAQGFWPVYEAAEGLGVPLFLHPTTPAEPQGLLDYRLVAIVGFLFDTTTAVGRMVFAGVFERFPKLTLILGHLGGAVPYLAERMDRGYAVYPESRELLHRQPSQVIRERCFLDAVNFDPDALRLGLAFSGRDRILLGSDYPHQVGDMPRAVRTIKELDVPEETRSAILGENAARLFRLQGRS